MTPNFLMTVLFPLVFVVMALFFSVIGLRGIVYKKPFVIRSRWFLILILLGFTPAMLPSIPFSGLGHSSGHLMIVQWLSLAILLVVLIFLSFTLRGYIAFGVTDTSFRDGLLASLKKLNFPHEETLAMVRLLTIGADLQVAVQSWIGTGQLKMKQRQFAGVLSEIVRGMNEYYQSGAVSKMNLTCCIFYLVVGVLMLLCAGGFLFAFSKMH
ncbi:MAG: hypothetical protein ACLQPD_30020 [Desulfomonilaceae bacterium]